MNPKVMFVVTIACAIVSLVLSIVTVMKARVTGSKKSLRAGFWHAGIALGWAVTAFWPDAWNWAFPVFLIVGTCLLSGFES